jgi:2-amino-4-hydroxy-6-hydroxymethyldihydropteridine diphosphokinase
MHHNAGVEIYLGLGSNIGDREAQLRGAVRELAQREIDIRRSASLYATEPRDLAEQPWFLNTVIEVRTLLEPGALLRECLEIERSAGRVRDGSKGPRPIDIDILLYRDRLIDEPNLLVPHPRYRERRFVLIPLAELIPDVTDPVCGLSMRQLLDLCPDDGEVRRHGDPLL